jgi:RND family efflux transporter MFP subunit
METKNIDLSSLKIDRSENHDGPKRSNGKYIIYGLSIIIAAAIIIFALNGSFFSSAVQVTTTTASLQSSSTTNAVLTASGYVVAQRKAAVASKGTGRLVYLGVVEGDKVKNNQIIARIEDSDIRAQLEQAKANVKLYEADLKQALTNFNRQKALLKTNSTSQMEVDAAEATYEKVIASIDVAKAQVTSAEVALENTLIRAPFDGTVLTKNADVGEVVAPLAASASSKGAVVSLADMKSLQVEADVSESNLEKAKINQDCIITLDAYPDVQYPGYVAKIVPTADRSKATVLVKVAFRNYDERVLPEMSAKVSFLTDNNKQEVNDEKPVLIVPSTAIVSRQGKDVVFTISDDKAVENPVKTGKKFENYTEVKEGLGNGDVIIEKPSDQIKNGVKVKVKE